MNIDWQNLINEMKQGSIHSLSRLITRVENREHGWIEAMKFIYTKTGKARVVGITGAPGVGKSSLTNRITAELIENGYRVGIIAIDPSSPFSGGALLGDRLRMDRVSNLEGVFVRSMAARGSMGGLNQAARDVVKILDAFGKDFVLIETVGVGQDEVEVINVADVIIVICVPGQGDNIQALKAGVMEIANIFVINKADLEGADKVASDIQVMLDLGCDTNSTRPLIIKTAANTGEGVPELVSALFDLFKTYSRDEAWQDKKIKSELIGLLENEVAIFLREEWSQDTKFENAVKQIRCRQCDPYSIIQEIINPVKKCMKNLP